MIKDAIAKVVDRLDLTEAEAEAAMHEIMEGQATPAQIAAYVTALRMKGEAVDEITGSARAMRAKAVRIHTTDPVVVDTCGTGGDGGATFNVSTAVAFVVAGAGVTVAKHGNRAVSSRSRSADELQALGVRLAPPPERAEAGVNELRDFGLQRVRAKDLEGGDAEENAQITRDILSGREGPRQQLVLVNAAPALVACGKAATLQDGVALARTIVQSGAAMDKLERLIKWTNR